VSRVQKSGRKRPKVTYAKEGYRGAKELIREVGSSLMDKAMALNQYF